MQACSRLRKKRASGFHQESPPRFGSVVGHHSRLCGNRPDNRRNFRAACFPFRVVRVVASSDHDPVRSSLTLPRTLEASAFCLLAAPASSAKSRCRCCCASIRCSANCMRWFVPDRATPPRHGFQKLPSRVPLIRSGRRLRRHRKISARKVVPLAVTFRVRIGLSDADLALLTQDGPLDVILNSAGLVSFNPSLESALRINVHGRSLCA